MGFTVFRSVGYSSPLILCSNLPLSNFGLGRGFPTRTSPSIEAVFTHLLPSCSSKKDHRGVSYVAVLIKTPLYYLLVLLLLLLSVGYLFICD